MPYCAGCFPGRRHPQGGQGEGAEEYDDSDDQQVKQAFGDHADDAQRDRCDY